MNRTDVRVRRYDVAALQVPIVFNTVADNTDSSDWYMGDHDHEGIIYTLEENRPTLERLRRDVEAKVPEALRPHDLVRPLVLRAAVGEQVRVRFTNHLSDRPAGMNLVGGAYDTASDGTHVGRGAASFARPGETVEYVWECPEEGAFVFHDLADPGGDETSSNAHGLFGALIVEPAGSWWTDPERGLDHEARDGMFVDVHRRPREELEALPEAAKAPFPDPRVGGGRSPKYAGEQSSFREYVLVFSDEPAASGPHPGPGQDIPSPVPDTTGRDTGHDGHHNGSLMCVNLRAEPMANREHWIFKRLAQGTLKRTVINEEQHHSSWMFGDPATPVPKAYLGDPVRIRLIHAGVKETHVFHLHLYEWHHDPDNHRSPLIDAITFGPQTGHTIEPLFGAGNLQSAPGDAIWHCHLYPHFHMGMWGLLRTFDTEQLGVDGPELADPDGRYAGRRVGRYPDGTRIRRLVPLPDRQRPPQATAQRPGFPLFVPGEVGQKSPVPPWPGDDARMPADFDYRPATALERAAFNADPKPGEMFTKFPHPDRVSGFETLDSDRLFELDRPSRVDHDVVAARAFLEFNEHGWHDDDGHLFHLADDREDQTQTRRTRRDPLFFRCRHGEVLNLTLHNDTVPMVGSPFDPPLPPRELLVDGHFPGELGLHVHMVKFDPIAGDGASTGWNYLSAPEQGKRMVYRWWADEEFGTIFTHDHLFANTRQRHGLYGALLVEPLGSTFHDPYDLDRRIVSGTEAAIRRADGSWFREMCLAVGDWTPTYDRGGEALEPPRFPGAHDDNGLMVVNYRNAPLRERGEDPSSWFRTHRRGLDTPVFTTHTGDPLTIRLLQGAHEEQHSFQVHGMRWRRFRFDDASPWRDQQTLGISEAFSFDVDRGYSPGDHLWRFSGAEDTWLGCWGLVRAFDARIGASEGPAPLPDRQDVARPVAPARTERRRFRVTARAVPITYRDGSRSGRSTLIDPLGLVFEATHHASPGARRLTPLPADDRLEPMVLRARAGDWVEVELHNHLPDDPAPEPSPPELPVEPEAPRTVSSRVSLHADLLDVDVRTGDGADVGRNPVQTVPRGRSVHYLWHVPEDLEPGPVLLQDMADVRNHRHHGLVGALVVEPADATPYAVRPGETTARPGARPAWTGTRASVVDGLGTVTQEQVLFVQDGLRYWVDGVLTDAPNPPDVEPAEDTDTEGTRDLDTEDQGHKAVNYRSERLDALLVRPDRIDLPARSQALALDEPATPTVHVRQGARLAVHVVGATDKPRNQVFAVHGHGWREWPHEKRSRLLVSSESGVTTGFVRRHDLIAGEPGDYLYRTGVQKWALAQGLWGIVRVHGDDPAGSGAEG